MREETDQSSNGAVSSRVFWFRKKRLDFLKEKAFQHYCI